MNQTPSPRRESPPRTETPLDTAWRFHLGEHSRALEPGLDDSDWQDVRLPHDWAIEQPTDYHMPQGIQQGFQRRAHVGWYRRGLDLSPEPGQRYRLRLDGAYRHAELWVNGQSFGVHPSGYVSRIHDITDALRAEGRQLIAVRCDNTAHDGDRWYAGAGLYRRVWLTRTGEVAIAPDGVFVTTPDLSDSAAQVHVRLSLQSHLSEQTTAQLSGDLLDDSGNPCATLEPAEVWVSPERPTEATLTATIHRPAMWSPESPRLYRALVRVEARGEQTDALATTFGVRRFAFEPQHGLVLNGQPRTMKGVCLHHDLGCLGTAFFADGWERRLKRLKEMGGDAIRTSHNPPDPALLDLCDRLGVMVINEGFDKWWQGNSGPFFGEHGKRDLQTMVKRDRNHPSVLVWSVGNEVENQCSPQMLQTCKMLADAVKALDPTRPTTVGLRPFENEAELWASPVSHKVGLIQKAAECVDIVGLNYMDQWYEAIHEAMPDRVFLCTEAFHFFQHQINGSWSMQAENPWLSVEAAPHVAGQFLWTGIEYLGETRQSRWPCRGWKGAPIDSAGFIKPRGWWHAAAWKSQPVVAAAVRYRAGNTYEPIDWSFPPLVDHWSLPLIPDELVEVWVFSNADRVVVQLNDVHMGEARPAEQPNRIASFFMPYRPGRLVAIGYDAQGREMGRHELHTVGEPERLRISPDRQTLRGNDQDLAHLTIEVVDAQGRRVPGAEHEIGVEVVGAARLIGMDSGDLTCHVPFASNRRPAYQGRTMAVLRAGHSSGPVSVTALAEKLPPATTSLSVQA